MSRDQASSTYDNPNRTNKGTQTGSECVTEVEVTKEIKWLIGRGESWNPTTEKKFKGIGRSSAIKPKTRNVGHQVNEDSTPIEEGWMLRCISQRQIKRRRNDNTYDWRPRIEEFRKTGITIEKDVSGECKKLDSVARIYQQRKRKAESNDPIINMVELEYGKKKIEFLLADQPSDLQIQNYDEDFINQLEEGYSWGN